MPAQPRQLPGRADLSVARNPAPKVAQAGAGVPEAPTRVRLPAQDVERLAFLEIRDRHGRELVTVVELLSPSNKRPGGDRDQYLAKRQTLLAGPAHLVEIDLLRGGRPMPAADRPGCDYSVLVSRAEDRPGAGFWPVLLRDRLPVIPVPLRAADGDARLDLQGVIHQVYDASGYEDYRYAGAPDPPLGADDEAWSRGLLPRPG